MLGVASDLPDALIGVVPMLDGGLDEAREALPHGWGDLGDVLAKVDVDRVEEHAPDVVLVLVPGAVADPDRIRPPVAGEMVERPLGQVALTSDAVHDLQLEGWFSHLR